MASSTKRPTEIAVGYLGKGCLAGLGLAVLFLMIGGLLYLILSLLGLPQSANLLIAIAGGPLIGSGIVIPIAWGQAVRAERRARKDRNHETASGNNPKTLST